MLVARPRAVLARESDGNVNMGVVMQTHAGMIGGRCNYALI